MWEDMGFREKISLDEADKAYSRWAKAEIKKRNVVGWIVETSNKVVAGGGCLWLRPAQPRPHLGRLVEPYLMSMFTEPEFRRSGVDSKIVNEGIKWCKRNGYRRILLHAAR
jgi:GNAT superfamily N-acetyltransferase